MSKHTPGPWRTSRRAAISDPRLPAFAILYGPAGTPIANVECMGNAALSTEANARLIAAAPDMLAALTKIAATERRNLSPSKRMTVIYETAAAALAKARGEA